jgi:asparagine synthase (glutamine-hydrolysing)
MRHPGRTTYQNVENLKGVNMCGIAVIYGKSGKDRIREMMDSIGHRGPDDRNDWSDQRCSMGHVRLSIIDLQGGRQPIFNEDGRYCIVFNGEIYNYRELFALLEKKHRFATHSDTEVILHLYEEIGSACLSRLQGMFAFAVYDLKEHSLFIARDRLGIKPLYWGIKNGAILFASEIKALLSCRKIEVFPPGSYFRSGMGFKYFYSLPEQFETDDPPERILERIVELLDLSVRRRLVADVPVGIFLSGGLDSNIIAGCMNRHRNRINSFTAGMKGADDHRFAEAVSRRLGFRHNAVYYTIDDVLRDLPIIIRHLESFDAPLVRSAIPCWYVSQLTNQNRIKVVLTGEGADELFAGYNYLQKLDRKADLFSELRRITAGLHFTNLQRVDRMTMAHSVEGRVPFLDHEFVNYVFSIPNRFKISPSKPEKWILREAFRHILPEELLIRKKVKFSKGAGSMELMKDHAEKTISDRQFVRYRRQNRKDLVRTKEEMIYHSIFKEMIPHGDAAHCAGRTSHF